MRWWPPILLAVCVALPAVAQPRLPRLPMDEPGWDDDGPVGGFSGKATVPEPPEEKETEPGPPEPAVVKPEREAETSSPQPPDAAAQTALDDSFKKLARLRHTEALRHFDTKDYPKALAALRAAYDLDPKDAEIVNDLAYLLHTLGNREDAVRFYREALVLNPDRYTAHINLADLLMEGAETEAALKEASQLLVRARELSGNKPSVILRQARVAARRGRFDAARLFYKEVEVRTELSDRRLLELGDFYRDFGRFELAREYYDRIAGAGPYGQEAQRRLESMEIARTARRYGWASTLKPVPVQAQALLARARLFLGQGRAQEARRLLEEALAIAPHYAQARMWLGDVLRRQGDVVGAEMAYLRALALDSSNGDIHLRLGKLYQDDDERNRSAEAVLFLTNALQLHPEWHDVRLLLARACQSSGDLAAAREQVVRYLADAAPDAAGRRAAEDLKEALAGVLSDAPDPPVGQENQDPGLPPTVVESLNRARSYLAQNRPDAAMAELLALKEANRHPATLNLKARILTATDRLAQAQARYEESLTLDPNQPDALEHLGRVLERRGMVGPALERYQESARLGRASARLQVLRLELHAPGDWRGKTLELVRPGRLWALRSELDQMAASHAQSPLGTTAGELRDEADGRLRALLLAYGAGVAVLLLALFAWWRRRFGGTDLQTLVARHPEAGPEVQRVLAAIRHEVLKHNTMLLAGLVQKLQIGGDAAREAQHLRDTLFGSSRRESGVRGQLTNYCDQLIQIGRAHGIRLNLHHRDPALSAILAGFATLEKLATRLERVDFMSPGQRSRLARQLEDAAQRLNVDGYEAVRSLLDQLRLLKVNPGLLEGIFQRICREPKLAALDLSPALLDVAAQLPLHILVPRAAFEDIMGNLVRNAIITSLENGIEPLQIGMGVAVDVDPITGFETARFAVRDRSPQSLTTEMIRGRYIEGGLGLSSDLVSRFEGSIDVEDGPEGWVKSVIVSFPLVVPETGEQP